MWVRANVSEREGGVIEAVKWVCLCARASGSELARRERNINSSLVFLDRTVRLAVDDVDVFVRGKPLSAGLIAEGKSCHVEAFSLSRPCWSH